MSAIKKFFVFTTLGVFSLVLLKILFLDYIMDVGSCDGSGLRNGQKVYYHSNGRIHLYGTVKNCHWDGEVLEYDTLGYLKIRKKYCGGKKCGSWIYYSGGSEIKRVSSEF